jgi:hypothetical protein
VKESRNRSDVAQGFPGGLGSQISWHSAREVGEVVSLTHRLPLPQECSWYSFSLGADSTPGPWYGRKEICHWKIQWQHRESIPGLPTSKRSALTTTLPQTQVVYLLLVKHQQWTKSMKLIILNVRNKPILGKSGVFLAKITDKNLWHTKYFCSVLLFVCKT